MGEVPQYIPWFGALKTGVVEVCIDRSESIVQHSRTIQGMCLGLRVYQGSMVYWSGQIKAWKVLFGLKIICAGEAPPRLTCVPVASVVVPVW